MWTSRAAALIAAVTVAAACSPAPAPGPSPEPIPEPSPDPALARMVPDSIRRDGVLSIGTDPSYPPMEFTAADGTTIVGADIDLAKAISVVLDLEPKLGEDAFTALPAAVRTGRFELGIAALSIPRGQPLAVNAVLYYRSGTRLVRNTSVSGLSLDSMCGFRIAAVEGSTQVKFLAEASKSCRARGFAAISIEAYSQQNTVTARVVSGQSEGMVTDTPVAEVAVRDHPRELVAQGQEIDPVPLGIVLSPRAPRLARAVRRALQELIDTGYYRSVLDRWGIPGGAVQRARIRWTDRPPRGQERTQANQDPSPSQERAVLSSRP